MFLAKDVELLHMFVHDDDLPLWFNMQESADQSSLFFGFMWKTENDEIFSSVNHPLSLSLNKEWKIGIVMWGVSWVGHPS